MTVYRMALVCCDHHGCSECVEIPAAHKADDARKLAHKKGWRTDSRRVDRHYLDLCPVHA